MTGLEQAFYIVGLLYMGISLLIILALTIAVVVIRKKIVSLERMVAEKVETFTAIPLKVADIVDTVTSLAKHRSK